MDANWQPVQGFNPPAGVDPNAPAAGDADAVGDWRAQLQPEARSRIVSRILETLRRHLPVSVPEGVNELQTIDVRLEEKIYAAATDQSDYLRKISLKMLSMETRTQQAPGNAQVLPKQNNPGQVVEPGVVTVMDDLDYHVDSTNSRIQHVQNRLVVLNKQAKGRCSWMSLLLSIVAIVMLVFIVWFLMKYLLRREKFRYVYVRNNRG